MLVGSRTGIIRLFAVILTSLEVGVVVADVVTCLTLFRDPGGRPRTAAFGAVNDTPVDGPDPGVNPTGNLGRMGPMPLVRGVGVPLGPNLVWGRGSWAGRGIGGRVTAARDAMDILVIGVIWSLEGGVLGLGGRSVTFTSMGGSFRPWGVL